VKILKKTIFEEKKSLAFTYDIVDIF